MAVNSVSHVSGQKSGSVYSGQHGASGNKQTAQADTSIWSAAKKVKNMKNMEACATHFANSSGVSVFLK